MKRKRSNTSHGSSRSEFEVFLSFRGPDTRANFTDSLYHALLDKGIHVFIDKKGIDVGEEIGLEIFQAIDDSKICIPIFSRGYASSSWCLHELEHMMQRRKTNEVEVMPIFYDVEPSDVKLQTEVYRGALNLHEEKHGVEIVQHWAEALQEVTKIKGWDTKNMGHGELARLIARKVLVKLKVSCFHISDHLVGMDESVNEVADLLNHESKDIRLIGIWGTGGIGKTTLAKVVYNKLSTNFESCSFISNIRETSKGSGLSNLQRQLISDILGDIGVELSSIDHGINMIRNRFNKKKVLIFLDDVDHRSQLMALVAKIEWFGSGSRIVVTTRDKSVLSGFQDQFEHCLIYEAKGLNSLEAFQLFSKHAFRSNSPPKEFLSLCKKVIVKTGGLPLAIEVMGSFLYGKKEAVWQDTLKKMENFPHKDVREKLILSYELLDHPQRQIFLDIACFLIGENKRVADYMWEDCGFFPDEGVEVLLLMSFVKIEENNQLWMHDQLKDLGRSIVYQENCKDLGKHSRVWNHEEALNVIKRKKENETIEAICMNFHWIMPAPDLTSIEFMKVPNIRFLKIDGGNLSGDFEDLFSELRWLSWKYGPSKLRATNFCPKNLLILDLSWSEIDERWGGWTQLKVATRLKVLNLSNCVRLSATPNLSAYLSLEILILEGCGNLLWIDRSIGHLRCLKHLNLNRCHRLQVLPVELGSLKALTELLIGNYIFFGSISQVPSSIGALVNLERLAICGAPRLTTLPNSIAMLKYLSELDVSNIGIVELPNTIVNLKSLKVLKMNRSRMKKLPEAIGMLGKLEEIYGEKCLKLEMIPTDIMRLHFLKILKLTQTRVQNVPKLPQSLVSLCLSSTATEKAPEISNLVSLRNLELCFASSASTEAFPKVRTYSPNCLLELPSITGISPYLGCLSCLKELELNDCKNLRQIGQLPSSLRKLTVFNCCFLEFVDLSNLENLRLLSITEKPFSRMLFILSNWNPKDFKLWDSLKLVEIQGLDRLESLESLDIQLSGSLRSIPDLSNLKTLKKYNFRYNGLFNPKQKDYPFHF